MRRHLGASAVGLALAGLLVAAPPSGAGLLGGDAGLNIGGRAGAVVGSVTGGGSGLGGTVDSATNAVTSATGGSSGAGLGGTLNSATSTVTGLTGGGAAGGLVGGLTGGAAGGLLGTLTTTLNSALSATGLTGLTGLVGAAGLTAGTYTPPLNDIGNPHGEGTVATATVGANLLPGVPGNLTGGEVVVGRSIGEYQATTTKQFHGHITILSLFGTEIFGVDSTPGQTNTGLTGSSLGNLCTGTGNTICLNVLKATSTTTNVSSINRFEALGVAIPGVVAANVASSDGNITVNPATGCETSFGDSHAANVTLGAVLPVADAVDSQSGVTTCNDATKNVAPASLSQVVHLLSSPLGLPIVVPTGCSQGGPSSTAFVPAGTAAQATGTPNTDGGIPLLLPVTCNADDTNGLSPAGIAQDPSIPYAVREALTVRVLQLMAGTAVAKVTVGASQASASAPGAIGTTTATTTGTTTSTTATAGTTTATAGTTTATTATTTATTATTGTTTATTGTTTATTGTTTSTGTTSTGTTSTGVPGGGNNSTGTTAGSTGTTGTTTGAETGPATTKSAELPFTGLNVLWLLLGGVTMLVAGTTLRRMGARRHPTE